jgi:hypothetical protein
MDFKVRRSRGIVFSAFSGPPLTGGSEGSAKFLGGDVLLRAARLFLSRRAAETALLPSPSIIPQLDEKCKRFCGM